MDTVKEPLDMPEYVDRFFKHCDQTLDTVPEGGIATSDLVLLPAEDSPEGPLTDVETWETRAAPFAAPADDGMTKDNLNRAGADGADGPAEGADTGMYVYDLNDGIPITSPSTKSQEFIEVDDFAFLMSPPPSAARTQRASAARTGTLWNAEHLAEIKHDGSDAVYVAPTETNPSEQEADTAMETVQLPQQQNGIKKVSRKRISKKKLANAASKRNGDDEYIVKFLEPPKKGVNAVEPSPQRESKRQRQRPSLYKDPDMFLDTDTALLEAVADNPADMAALLLEGEEAERLEKMNEIHEAAAAAAEVVDVPTTVAEEKLQLDGKKGLKRADFAVEEGVEIHQSPPPAKKAKKAAVKSPKQTPPAAKRKHQQKQQRSKSIPLLPTTTLRCPPPPLEHPLFSSAAYQQPSVPPHTLTKDDILLGCNKCRYFKAGCGNCRDRPPAFTRPPNRWDPFQAHHQVDIPAIPSFRPTKEEFVDPVAYITKIMPEAMKYGLAHIIPPEGWDPPFALEKGTNGVSMESFKFAIRKQLTSHLCYRSAQPSVKNTTTSAGNDAPLDGGKSEEGGAAAAIDPNPTGDVGGDSSRYSKKKKVKKNEESTVPAPQAPLLTAEDVLAALAAANSAGDGGLENINLEGTQNPLNSTPPPQKQQEQEEGENGKTEEEEEESAADDDDKPGGIKISGEHETIPISDFGFVALEKKQTLRSFAAYADWVKAVHFSDPPPLGQGTSSAPKRRPLKILPVQHTLPVEPSVEEIEAEFWRIVETPDSYLESLYGQDLDSGHHGSGFPLPEWRRRLLEEHLARTNNNKINIDDASGNGCGGGTSGGRMSHTYQTDISDINTTKSLIKPLLNTEEKTTTATAAINPPTTKNTTNISTLPSTQLPAPSTEAEIFYSEHPWNINNMPRSKSSMLRYLLGDGLITGVMVPWLYVGSCLSAFCWHVEDHALYSVNYLHMGAPKVWYGVPANATLALEEAMKDALPHLFESNPGLLHELVTTISPMELKKRGVPVHRVVHEAGSFIVTMPDAYHSGFNTGFNCAEAVNFAAPGWIPFGTDISQKYRDAVRPVTMSHDSLLVALTTSAQHVKPTKVVSEGVGTEVVKEVVVDKGKEGVKVAISINNDGTATVTVTFSITTTPTQPETISAATDVPTVQKQANGFGPLGDIPWADAPLDGIILGTGELALRAAEEKERWASGAHALISLHSSGGGVMAGNGNGDSIPDSAIDVDSDPEIHVVVGKREVKEEEKNGSGEKNDYENSAAPPPAFTISSSYNPLSSTQSAPSLLDVLPCRTMDPCTSKPGSKNPVTGVYEDTAECDCVECQGDLWLAAVVSPAAPDVAVCPEHAASLVQKHNCPLDSLVLLCRYSPDDLQQLVDVAVSRIQGADAAVAAAHDRRKKLEEERVRALRVGPLYSTNEHGECVGTGLTINPEGAVVVNGAVDTGAAAVPVEAPKNKRGRKPKAKKNYYFKKKNKLNNVNVVDDTKIKVEGALPPPDCSLAPCGSLPLALAPVVAPDTADEMLLDVELGAAQNGVVADAVPIDDVDMVMLPQEEKQEQQQPEQQQQFVGKESAPISTRDTDGLKDITEFASVLDAVIEQHSEEVPLPNASDILRSNYGMNTATENTTDVAAAAAEAEAPEVVKTDDAVFVEAEEAPVRAPEEVQEAHVDTDPPRFMHQNEPMFNLNSDF